MFLEKIDEINFDENDIYFLEVVGNKIIVNDNYSGVLILNSDLIEGYFYIAMKVLNLYVLML